MQNNYIIYAHINMINNKIYIGQTSQSLTRRFRTNGDGYKNCTYFYKAIQKYGWNNFKHIILFEKLSLEKANEIEKYLIKKYQTTNPDFGYNINLGGHGLNSFSKENISKKTKDNWEKGVYDKIKNSVYCVELNKEFESALEAQRKTGIDNSSIQKACKHILKYSGYSPEGQPLHWIFTSEKTPELIKQLYFKPEILKGVGIPLYCPELNQIFNSAQDVENKYQIDASSIRKASKTGKTAGFHNITKEPLHWIIRPDLIKTKSKITKERWSELINGSTGSN